jgi:hypothetical protein
MSRPQDREDFSMEDSGILEWRDSVQFSSVFRRQIFHEDCG